MYRSKNDCYYCVSLFLKRLHPQQRTLPVFRKLYYWRHAVKYYNHELYFHYNSSFVLQWSLSWNLIYRRALYHWYLAITIDFCTTVMQYSQLLVFIISKQFTVQKLSIPVVLREPAHYWVLFHSSTFNFVLAPCPKNVQCSQLSVSKPV